MFLVGLVGHMVLVGLVGLMGFGNVPPSLNLKNFNFVSEIRGT